MKSWVVISAVPIDLQRAADVYRPLGRMWLHPDSVTVDGSWGWFRLEHSATVEREFSDEALRVVHTAIPRPVFCLLDYREKFSADLAIMLLPASEPILVENGFRLFLPLEQVRDRIRWGEPWHEVWGIREE
ncbi:MAG: hypothetical protein IT535_10145 [Bauldia sp.]|nr:hypothetical protein [Bauldia sp.]